MSTTKGNIVKEGDRASIVFERRLNYPIEEVWEALTDPEQLGCWFGHVVLEKRQGGSITVEAGPQHIPVEIRRTTGRILTWEPPHVLEYEWKQAIVEESTIRFELTTDGTTTILKLAHRWLSIGNAGGFVSGWHAYLDRLEAHLTGNPIPDWGERFGEVQSLYS